MLPPRTYVAYLSSILGQSAGGTHLILHLFGRHNDGKTDYSRPKSPETAEKQKEDSQKALQRSRRGKRAYSNPFKGRQAKQRTNHRVAVGAVEPQPAWPAPPRATRTRTITAPKDVLSSAKALQAYA
jgi:hypothetical protein